MQPAPEKIRQIGLRVEWCTAGEKKSGDGRRNRKKEGVWAWGGGEKKKKKNTGKKKRKKDREPRSSYAWPGGKKKKQGGNKKIATPGPKQGTFPLSCIWVGDTKDYGAKVLKNTIEINTMRREP